MVVGLYFFNSEDAALFVNVDILASFVTEIYWSLWSKSGTK
jgi:hypothetical protein